MNQLKTVLVIDDEVPILDLVASILNEAGYQVVTAGDGEEGLARVENVRPDVVLSDVMMPRMDGREICSRLRSSPSFRNIPIVLMSAGHSRVSLDGCEYDAFLRKPFGVDELLAT